MPSFKGTLTDAQIKCIATVVANVSGGDAAPSPQAVACKGLHASARRPRAARRPATPQRR